VNSAEFDRYAQDYLSTHARNIKLSGEAPDYFARYKIEEVRRVWSRSKLPEPSAILDFGAGVGNSLPHLQHFFPAAKITALDVSAASLALAQQRFPGSASFVCGQGEVLATSAQRFDLIFSSCVFHHIDAAQHVRTLGQLKELLAPDGRAIVFEHNPVNPVTRYIVATCKFDEDAVLIPAGVFRARQQAAGFARVEVNYTGFFPGALSALRPAERFLTKLPIGAQYYTIARG
jgi:ubiquinone/menaquinone biosynthesis C-methylase UbiE